MFDETMKIIILFIRFLKLIKLTRPK